MRFGFSWTGLVFLLMLYVPNMLWARRKPDGYDEAAERENRILLAFERTGEALVSALMLFSGDPGPKGAGARLLWLAAAFMLMLLYEAWWIRYFRSGRTMADFYSPILGIPVAGATLPVIAVLLFAAYCRNPLLFVSGVVLGIGHIGIHLCHRRALGRKAGADGPENDSFGGEA